MYIHISMSASLSRIRHWCSYSYTVSANRCPSIFRNNSVNIFFENFFIFLWIIRYRRQCENDGIYIVGAWNIRRRAFLCNPNQAVICSLQRWVGAILISEFLDRVARKIAWLIQKPKLKRDKTCRQTGIGVKKHCWQKKKKRKNSLRFKDNETKD